MILIAEYLKKLTEHSHSLQKVPQYLEKIARLTATLGDFTSMYVVAQIACTFFVCADMFVKKNARKSLPCYPNPLKALGHGTA